MKNRGIHRAFALAAALAAGALWAPAAGAEPLRVCADPDNLPFSKAEGPEKGLYVEVIELVARKLDRPVEYVWWYTHNQRRMLRNTINKNTCDVVAALPSDYRARTVLKSKPFLEVGYALVAAPGFAFKGLDDLKGKRIGVQFGSTPQVVLATMGGFQTTTYREGDELFAALAKGEIDVAFLWGPSAGYDNARRHAGRWAVTPVAGHDLSGSVSIAIAREQEELAKQIDAVLPGLKSQIEKLADKYAFPRAKPVDLSYAAAPERTSAVRVPAQWTTRVQATAGADPKAGRVKFNDACSHCHGADGFSPVRERDLRRLKSRYDDKWEEVARTTIANGRVDKGMPTWKDILKDQEMKEVMAFLNTIQK
jgi:polar amino acid transport system substrate-binding protein